MTTRRAFLKASGLSLLSFGVGPDFLRRAALAAAPPRQLGGRRVLVAIFQRGAMDGLAAVPLVAEEAALRRLRPRLALGAAASAGTERVLDLDGRFGLHPGFAALRPLFGEGRLAIVHGVGSPDPTRSHFDAQDFMESGLPGRRAAPSGWLNRVVGELGHEGTPLKAMALTASMPRSLSGPAAAIAVADLAELRAPGGGTSGGGFEALYRQATDPALRSAAADTFEAVRLLAAEGPAALQDATRAGYPPSPLGQALRQIARLIRADVGLEVAFAETAGWDTHVQQGAAQGSFARRASDLARAIAAFWSDLGSHQDDVVLMTMTEFGRTVAENGSGGTDHGHGSCLFVVGNRVAGGRVHGGIESLDRDALYEGRDLPVQVDFRSVFAEVAARHLGVSDRTRLFPGFVGPTLPLFRSA